MQECPSAPVVLLADESMALLTQSITHSLGRHSYNNRGGGGGSGERRILAPPPSDVRAQSELPFLKHAITTIVSDDSERDALLKHVSLQ